MEGDRLVFTLGTVCDTEADGSHYDIDTQMKPNSGKELTQRAECSGPQEFPPSGTPKHAPISSYQDSSAQRSSLTYLAARRGSRWGLGIIPSYPQHTHTRTERERNHVSPG